MSPTAVPPSTLHAAPLPAPQRLGALIDALEAGLLERGTAARLALLGALAGEHVLLIGPPGTAKSELARRLHRAFDGARYFERLLTRFSTPEELFGPLSLKALEDDRYERLIDGYLPTAGVAFLDEVFKANSAILNALLTLLNEREYDHGSGRLRTPLISVVGASNEVPADESLQAFFDRFLLRVPVAGVGDASFAALLNLVPPPPAAVDAIRPDERAAVAAAREQVALSAELLQALQKLREWLAPQGIVVSDRRWRQIALLLRTEAATEGRAEADALDLWLAPYVVGAEAAQFEAAQRWVADTLADALPREAPWLARAVEAFEKQLQVEHRMQRDEAEQDAGKIALARAIGRRDERGEPEDGGMARLLAGALEERMRARFSPVHVQARLAQVDEIDARAEGHRAALQAQADALRQRLRGRLWLAPDVAAAWCGALDGTLARLDGLRRRLAEVRAGFAVLPTDAALPAVAPEPVALDA